MRIKLSPQRRDDTLEVIKAGNVLTVNGQDFDFSQMADGDTLPNSAISSEWFAGDVDKVAGELIVTLLLPNPWNYSPEQAFPVTLENVPDGPVVFPSPLSEEETAAKFPRPVIEYETVPALIITDASTGKVFAIEAAEVSPASEFKA